MYLLLMVLAAQSSPEERAIAFLSREVPRWSRENNCYSCHNNGDAARALFAALRAGMKVSPGATADTIDWLERPSDWDENGGEDGFSDPVLARIQFASALVDATRGNLTRNEEALARAAEIVASDQSEDGSWRLDASSSIGSPATYGAPLATWAARRVLLTAGAERFKSNLERSEAWFLRLDVQTVLDGAAVLLALRADGDGATLAQRSRGLDILERARAPSGGWGPYVTSAPEPFDTAVVVLALQGVEGADPMIREGVDYLLRTQLEDGSWPETTRPAGQRSYAQYISTTGWATLALLSAER